MLSARVRQVIHVVISKWFKNWSKCPQAATWNGKSKILRFGASYIEREKRSTRAPIQIKRSFEAKWRAQGRSRAAKTPGSKSTNTHRNALKVRWRRRRSGHGQSIWTGTRRGSLSVDRGRSRGTPTRTGNDRKASERKWIVTALHLSIRDTD